ncbi:uv excision repair protein rad23 [Anopheles darlingi]|uniref:UV excision repair protein RAD23 n=1 Tax=Anopheles darlingi TaxID=43151 RepID=W5JSF7_ANODA|nr:UV excision repair protein RAD23 homolog A [Anopheles darlingi]XP_049535126.1 UV excision repair protein RAD23 homolog A [Anopheles darlingi]ETN66238.1 uv excision repair protein rad23 [Anopheles darlingi]
MKITLKTLKQQTFHVEVDVEKDTVRMLKEKIFSESGQAYPVERQWLIYLGKVMEDSHPLSQYNLDDKKFVVVMNKKSTVCTNDAETAGVSSSKRSDTDLITVVNENEKLDKKEPESNDAVAKPKDVANEVSSPNKSTASTSVSASAPSPNQQKTETDQPHPQSTGERPATGDEPNRENMSREWMENVRRISEMGYPEVSVIVALEICSNNREAAVEYLMDNAADMAVDLLEQQSAETPAASVPGIGVSGLQAPDMAVAAGGARNERPLAFLRGNPVFFEMKRLLQEDPSLLPYLMQRIQYSNPNLMRIISENQEEFLAMINENSELAPDNREAQELESIAAAMVNSLTPSDMDAIDRLKALGYPEHLVIQAYIACERDEYKAAEFLVSQNLEDED